MTPGSGSIPAGSSATVDVTLDATDLVAGVYNANIVVGSNDPLNPEVTVPVTLGVDQRITGIGDDMVPTKFELYPNRPNPFNPTTTIGYTVPVQGKVSLKIYDVSGRYVTTLVDDARGVGRYSATWNGVNSTGDPVGSGVYFYRLNVGNEMLTKKMVLLK